jgi:hypothetical protein
VAKAYQLPAQVHDTTRWDNRVFFLEPDFFGTQKRFFLTRSAIEVDYATSTTSGTVLCDDPTIAKICRDGTALIMLRVFSVSARIDWRDEQRKWTPLLYSIQAPKPGAWQAWICGQQPWSIHQCVGWDGLTPLAC